MNRKRSWILGSGAAIVATAATITAVAVMGGENPATSGPDDVPPAATPSQTTSAPADPTPSPTPTTPSTAPATSKAVPAYYVGDSSRGPRLYREFHQVDVAEDAVLTAAVEEAVAGTPLDRDYRSPWPDGTHADAVTYNGDVLTVSLVSDKGPGALHDRPAGMSEAEAEAAVQQVIYTAQAALQKGRPGVQLLLDGKHSDTVLGVFSSEPLAQGEAIDVLAQVWVISPAEGATVESPFEVSGLAASFEANVQWELLQGTKVVEQGFTTAEECCTMAPYTFTVDAPPGTYTLVVHDEDASGGEGFEPWQDTKTVTVAP
jgi:hypothetical protein